MTGQNDFRTALLNADQPIPTGLTDPKGRPAGRRFDIYRNNVVVSLTDALETAFPIVRKIVGEAFFSAMAGVYLRENPPNSPLLMFYGEDMPAFLAKFPPVAHLGYLPDVARLELARRQAYHAADAKPVGPEVLAGAEIMSARFQLAPALHVIRSGWPLYGIWLANTSSEAPKIGTAAEDVLITRPEFDPIVSKLPKGGADFIDALRSAQPLDIAIQAAGDGFDPGPVLTLLLQGGALTALGSGE